MQMEANNKTSKALERSLGETLWEIKTSKNIQFLVYSGGVKKPHTGPGKTHV